MSAATVNRSFSIVTESNALFIYIVHSCTRWVLILAVNASQNQRHRKIKVHSQSEMKRRASTTNTDSDRCPNTISIKEKTEENFALLNCVVVCRWLKCTHQVQLKTTFISFDTENCTHIFERSSSHRQSQFKSNSIWRSDTFTNSISKQQRRRLHTKLPEPLCTVGSIIFVSVFFAHNHKIHLHKSKMCGNENGSENIEIANFTKNENKTKISSHSITKCYGRTHDLHDNYVFIATLVWVCDLNHI